MTSSNRLWNGRPSGLPSALLITFIVVVGRIKDRLSTMLWRGNLGRLGHGAIIQSNVTIRNPGNLQIGDRTLLSRGVEVSSERVDSFCEIGRDSQLGRNVRLDFTGGVLIGSDVVISERTTIFTHSHGVDPKSVPVKTPLTIGDGTWIGAGALIVEGVSAIGNGAVIAAGSVVTREVPPRTLVAGVPARVIRVLDTDS